MITFPDYDCPDLLDTDLYTDPKTPVSVCLPDSETPISDSFMILPVLAILFPTSGPLRIFRKYYLKIVPLPRLLIIWQLNASCQPVSLELLEISELLCQSSSIPAICSSIFDRVGGGKSVAKIKNLDPLFF